ncbi:MAG: hypothetical protein ABI867_28745 [Kofleriaceae bacterium]
MFQRSLVLASTVLAGCSLIYNPSNLPTPEADASPDSMQDAEIILDADPTQLELERVSPTTIFEGTGTGGSRKALITVHGKQIVPGAKISFSIHGGGPATKITVDDAATDVAANGFMVAAPITIAVDPALTNAMKLRLDVTVTQLAGATEVTRTLSELVVPVADTPVLELQGLDELNVASIALASGVHEYSQVTVSGVITAADNAAPLIVRARGSIALTGADAAGAGRNNGPGGGLGGAAGGALGTGGTGAGAGGGKANGGGAGFATAGAGGTAAGAPAGDPQLTTLAAPNRGSGGGGGNGGALNAGGAGGGGGGTIELSAGGTLIAGTVTAHGGNGGPNTGLGASDGGGGSGGVVLLRSGVSVAATAVDVAGGTGLNAGAVGRIRTDAPNAIPTTTPAAYRGPSFAETMPLITRNDDLMLNVFGQPDKPIKYVIFNEDRSLVKGPFNGSISPAGSNMFPVDKPLFRGLNTICLQVDAGDTANDTRNCIDIVYLFTPE